MIRLIARASIAAILLAIWPLPSSFAAGTPTLTVISPTPGGTITSTDIPVQVHVANFKLDCLKYGRPDEPGVGHIHALIDGTSLANLTGFYCTPTFTIPGQGLSPGVHELLVDLATNPHADLPTTVTRINLDYEPTTPPPSVPAVATGAATAQIIGITEGATIGPRLSFTMATTNLQLSASLEGKQKIAGWGHFHVWIDMPPMDSSGQMSSLAGLVAMPGTNDVAIDLSAWPSGRHTLTIEVAQNDHTPYPGLTPIALTFILNNPAAPAGATATSRVPPTMPNTGDPDALLVALPVSLLLLAAGFGLRRLGRSRRD